MLCALAAAMWFVRNQFTVRSSIQYCRGSIISASLFSFLSILTLSALYVDRWIKRYRAYAKNSCAHSRPCTCGPWRQKKKKIKKYQNYWNELKRPHLNYQVEIKKKLRWVFRHEYSDRYGVEMVDYDAALNCRRAEQSSQHCWYECLSD